MPSSIDYLLPQYRIALGQINGIEFYEKFGRATNVDATTTPKDIWNGGGDYTGFPTSGSPETLSIVSSDATDTAAGNGMRTLRLYGLDGDLAEQTEDITLNGTTPVISTKTWWRMYRAWGLSAGQTGYNAGNITIRHSTTTDNIFAVMPATFGQTQIAAKTIPGTRKGIITRIKVAISNNNTTPQEATISLVTRDVDSGLWRVREPLIVSTGASAVDANTGGILVQPGTDTKIRVLSATSSGLIVAARYDIFEVDN